MVSKMSRHTSSSSRSSTAKSSSDSTFSRSSRHSYKTNNTSFSDTPVVCKSGSKAPVFNQTLVAEPADLRHEASPRSSVETYASTVASRDDLSDTSIHTFPKDRRQCFAPDSIPTSPPEFGRLFPSTRRLMIQHDDSTIDGNMNLRVDTEVNTSSGKRKKFTLFHLRMKDLAERQFSLRRYCRESGREVASSKRRYVKPMPTRTSTSTQQAKSSPRPSLSKKPAPPKRADSGYEADEDSDAEFDEALRTFTAQAHLKATIPTNNIRLEFSNYAQVIVEPRSDAGKEYGFEYWGETYTWQRRTARDEGEIIYIYDLINKKTAQKVASLTPDALSSQEQDFEAAQGAWIPASTMRILSREVSDDLGDVIVATGLISLTDDCLQRQYQQGRRLS